MVDDQEIQPSDNDATYGQHLYAYLERRWTADGYPNLTRWALKYGMDPGFIGKWKGRVQAPTLDRFREVADATGIPILELIIATGVLTSAEEAGLPRNKDEQEATAAFLERFRKGNMGKGTTRVPV